MTATTNLALYRAAIPPATRCLQTEDRDYRRMEKALAWLADNFHSQPGLAEAAARADMSAFHFQRLFARWVGLTPKKYVQYLTLNRAKQALRDARSVFDSALDAGLSGPGRLHDLFVSVEAMTPGEFKCRGEGLEIRYGFAPTPFGQCLLAHTVRGVCGLNFVDARQQAPAFAQLQARWPRAAFTPDPRGCEQVAAVIFGATPPCASTPLKLLLGGTPFQIKVWEALLNIPVGGLASYQDLASAVGQPSASRAVAGAVSRNPVGCLIPCHRVIRKSGVLGGVFYQPKISQPLEVVTVAFGCDAALPALETDAVATDNGARFTDRRLAWLLPDMIAIGSDVAFTETQSAQPACQPFRSSPVYKPGEGLRPQPRCFFIPCCWLVRRLGAGVRNGCRCLCSAATSKTRTARR